MLCVLGTETLAPTPDGHEHGKQDRPLVVDHVSDLEKIKGERDGAAGCRGCGTSGSGERLSGPLATLLSLGVG